MGTLETKNFPVILRMLIGWKLSQKYPIKHFHFLSSVKRKFNYLLSDQAAELQLVDLI